MYLVNLCHKIPNNYFISFKNKFYVYMNILSVSVYTLALEKGKSGSFAFLAFNLIIYNLFGKLSKKL